MVKLVITFRYIALLMAFCLLSGCLGGTIAQQIVRSIATSVADKAMAQAMDVDEDQLFSNRDPYQSAEPLTATPQGTGLQSASMQSTSTHAAKPQLTKSGEIEVNDYTYAMATFGFTPVQPIKEPLPEEVVEVETRITIVQGNQLVRVELFNILIGDEKNAVYEQARLMGATGLPQKREWQSWNVGTGVIKTSHEKDKKMITFLIPPEFGKLPSGATTMVELASPGELNVARYKAN